MVGKTRGPALVTMGGCGRKVGQADLSSALKAVDNEVVPGRPNQSVGTFYDSGDVGTVLLSEEHRGFATSTDLVYPVCEDAEEFGYIAAVHSLSDLYAALATPLWATLAVGVTRRDVEHGLLGPIMQGVRSGIADNGGTMVGGHSAYSAETFAVVSVTGLLESRPIVKVTTGDIVVLSKPLGVGIALAAQRMGLINSTDSYLEIQSMRRSNRDAAQSLQAMRQRYPEAIKSVTDVSGFGLLAGLRSAAVGYRVMIDSTHVPSFPRTLELIRLGAASPLGDGNMLAAERSVLFEVPPSGLDEIRVLLNDPQTSGGLLAVVTPEAFRDLQNFESATWVAIGEIGGPGSVVGDSTPPIAVV